MASYPNLPTATTKQHPQTPKQAPHPLGARSTKGTTIFPEIVLFLRLFIGGGHTVWPFFVALFKFSKFRVSCRFRFVSKIAESDENRPHHKNSNF